MIKYDLTEAERRTKILFIDQQFDVIQLSDLFYCFPLQSVEKCHHTDRSSYFKPESSDIYSCFWINALDQVYMLLLLKNARIRVG